MASIVDSVDQTIVNAQDEDDKVRDDYSERSDDAYNTDEGVHFKSEKFGIIKDWKPHRGKLRVNTRYMLSAQAVVNFPSQS